VCGAPVGCLGCDFDHATAAEPAVSNTLARGYEARHPCDVLRASDRLQIFVQHLVDRRHTPRRRQHVIELERRLAVDDVERRGGDWPVSATVARPAGHDLAAAEVVAVDRGHHLHHATRGALARRVESPVDVIGAGGGMATDAVGTHRRRHDAHRQHEVVDAQAFQRLHVLEGVVDHRWS
jgi:hypothetical protein